MAYLLAGGSYCSASGASPPGFGRLYNDRNVFAVR